MKYQYKKIKMKSKKELERTVEVLERKQFLNVYFEFNNWLSSIGFRSAKYNEGCSYTQFHYSDYDKFIDSMHSVECYLHDTLDWSIYFLRDRNEHKFMFVGNLGAHSEVYSLEEMKELILIQLRELRDVKLSELNKLINI